MARSEGRLMGAVRRMAPRWVKRRVAASAISNRLVYRAKVRLLARRCDVFVVSFPKCGRTWLRMMIGQALQRRFGFAERRVMMATAARVVRPGMPRVLATHDDEPQLKDAGQVFTDKRPYRTSKVILLVRDPRDVVVSWFHHRSRRTEGDLRYDGTLDEFAASGVVASIVAFYNAWATQRHVPSGFLLVRYEEMRRDPEATLRRVLDFIGVTDATDAQVRGAVEASSFDRMRQMEQRGGTRGGALRPGDPDDPDSFKVRRGVVGGYRTSLSPDRQADLDERLRHLDPLYAEYR